MASKAKTKPQVKGDIELTVGNWHKFNGYNEEQDEPILEEGVAVEILGYDEDEETYNVRDVDGNEESLFISEISEDTVSPPKAKTKAKDAAKSKAKAKVEDDEDETETETETEGEEEDEGELPKFEALGVEADAKTDDEGNPTTKAGKKAVKELEKAAGEYDLDPADSKTWTALGKKIDKLELKKAKQEAKPVKPEPAPLVAGPVKKTASVTASIKEAGDALQAAQSLVDRVDSTYFTLGGVLAEINQKRLYEQILDDNDEPVYNGQPGFAQYCENTLGLKYRKAAYLIQLYLKFTTLGFSEKKLAGIGWTKLRELVGVVDEGNVEEWIESVKEQSVAEVRESVKIAMQDSNDGTASTGAGKALVKTVRYTFVAHADKAEAWNEALAKAAAELGVEDEAEAVRHSQCIDHIFSQYLALE